MGRIKIKVLLCSGEGLSVEFKRCSGRIEHDVFEPICAFLNRFGGDLLLGVEDDGTVVGVGDDAVALRNNIMNTTNDERMFDVLTPDNLQPSPRNPIVASFFREIAYADQLGSGVWNLFKYSKAYGGADPIIKDGDTFRITVLLKTVEVVPIGAEVAQKLEETAMKLADKVRGDGAENAIKVLKALMSNCKMAISEMERMTGLSNGSVKNAIRLLRLNGMIRHEGRSRGGEWVVLL